MTLAIMTDSTSYLDKDYIKDHQITVLPLMVNFSDDSYREMEDISVAEFYDKMDSTGEIPTSSQPSYGQVVEAMDQLAESHDRILAITISSGISGTYDSFVMAANKIKNADVRVIDSKLTCKFLADYIDQAVRLDKAGATLDEIVQHIEKMKEKTEVILSVNNLQNFRKSGRVSNMAGIVGDMLQIRPILEFQDGKIVATEKVRTGKRVISYMMDQLAQAKEASDRPLKAILLECFPGKNSQIQLIKEALKEEHPDISIEEGIVGPVIGAHTGPTVYALGWMVDCSKE